MDAERITNIATNYCASYLGIYTCCNNSSTDNNMAYYDKPLIFIKTAKQKRFFRLIDQTFLIFKLYDSHQVFGKKN